jgi:hypothetical protein
MRVRIREGLICGSVALLLAADPAAGAEETVLEDQFGWSIEAGAERSDNIARTDTDELDETTGILGLGLNIITQRPRLASNIAADLEYRDYLDREFESEISGGLNGRVDFAFIPERFEWVVEDNYGQIARNRQVADRPDNREQINYLSTGPELTLPLGARTNLLVSGRYTDTYLEESIEDNQATLASVSLVRSFSETTSISLDTGASKTEFDEETFPEYDTRQASLGLQLRAPRTTLLLDAGWFEWEQEGATEPTDFVMARIDFTRVLTRRTQLRLVAGTRPSSTGENFRRDQVVIGIGDGAEAAQAAADIFTSDDAYVSWLTQWDRTSLDLVVSARREEHEVVTDLDREQYRGLINWSRRVGPSASLDLSGGYIQEERTTTGFKFDEWFAGGEFEWQFARSLSLHFRLYHSVGSSDDGTRDYTENRAYVGIRYTGGDGGTNGGGS